ncbi:hypothetical protein MMC10_003481 [Thelotrema lepadinum]|nr:hypothetical protein [Thelotrema lepadinum]
MDTTSDIPSQTSSSSSLEKQVEPQSTGYGWHFWAMFPGLGISAALVALDATILSVALPGIVDDLDSGTLYIWLINSYTLTMTACQPVYGQIADLLGRKITILSAIALFFIGSTVCALAHDTKTMIAGRLVQGMGAGGISFLPSLIISDLVPLKKRQLFTSIIYSAWALGIDLGPIAGGFLLERVSWRWIFWLNLPVSGFAFVLIALFLRVHNGRTGTILHQIAQIDFTGNLILVAAITSILLALSEGGNSGSWGSWQTILQLVLGFLGLGLFVAFEGSSWCKRPTMPLHLFSNRTSFIGYLLTFLHGLLLYCVIYFLPVYFQAVLEEPPQQAGIDMLPSMVPLTPFCILGGWYITRTNRYKVNQLLGFASMAIGIGLFILLNQQSSAAEWAIFQLIFSVGAGVLMTAALPAIYAPLAESDVALATATWGFIQSLGYIWGGSIPSSVFNSQFDKNIFKIDDAQVRQQLSDGNAYQHATQEFVTSLSEPTKTQAIGVFVSSLTLVWEICLAFALIAFVATFFIKEVKLREELDTNFGYINEAEVAEIAENANGPEPSSASTKAVTE